MSERKSELAIKVGGPFCIRNDSAAEALRYLFGKKDDCKDVYGTYSLKAVPNLARNMKRAIEEFFYNLQQSDHFMSTVVGQENTPCRLRGGCPMLLRHQACIFPHSSDEYILSILLGTIATVIGKDGTEKDYLESEELVLDGRTYHFYFKGALISTGLGIKKNIPDEVYEKKGAEIIENFNKLLSGEYGYALRNEKATHWCRYGATCVNNILYKVKSNIQPCLFRHTVADSIIADIFRSFVEFVPSGRSKSGDIRE